MTNQNDAKALFNTLARAVEWRIERMHETYLEARAKVKEKSIAGAAVWKMLDKKYG